MATMIPSVISPEVKSNAEKRIFEWFKNAPNTDDWIVLHSLGISNHNKVLYGETDFFVLAPGMGLFALEVKGGRVKRQNGIWYFTNKYGKTDSKERGPFDQAKDGAFSIIDAIKRERDNSHFNVGEVFFSFGVMFPDIEYTASGTDQEQWQVFDSRNEKNVKEYIIHLSKMAQRKWINLYGNFNKEKLPTRKDVKYIASILRGDFDCALSINAQLQHAEESLLKLTKEQYRCIDQIDDNPRCLIQGAAGTGKTLLALEEAKKSAAKGEKVALFCFNSNLAEWLNYYFVNIAEELRPSYVGTFHRYMRQVADTHGLSERPPSDLEEQQLYYKSILPNKILDLIDDEDKFDKIIVDEAQDLISIEYISVFDACIKKGFERGKWTMFGDFSMQAIYSDGMTGAEMKEMLEEFTSFIKFKLTQNCRNTKQICDEIETITGFVPPSDLWVRVEGPPVNYITFASEDEEKEKLEKLLAQLIDSHVDPSNITLLSSVKRENSIVDSLKNKKKIHNFKAEGNTGITFSTIQAYKGLENSVIIIADVEHYDYEKLMYVGLSRARTGLYILESDNAHKQYLELTKRRLFGGR